MFQKSSPLKLFGKLVDIYVDMNCQISGKLTEVKIFQKVFLGGLLFWTSTGCVSKRESSTNSVSWCSSVSTAWHLRISLSSYNRSRSWSHDSASDLPARQRSSCQRPEGRRSVTDLSLLPAPGLGTVCRPLSLQRPLCHHSVDT